MYNESDLLEDSDMLCLKTEDLALKCILNVEIPICGILTKLTAKNCNTLINVNLDDWSNENQPTLEKILFNYLITDYISCGLSFPTFYTVFHRSLQTDKSKTKFIRHVILIWNRLFKDYKFTSLNIEFVKSFLVSLDRLFINISNSVSEDIKVKYLCDRVISVIKKNIRKFERKNVISQILNTLNSNIEVQNTNKNKQSVLDIENLVSKKTGNQHIKQCRHNIENMKYITLNDQQKESLDVPLIDHHVSKKQKLMSNNTYNIPNLDDESDPKTITIQPQEQKLNAFQIMMRNAKKRKC